MKRIYFDNGSTAFPKAPGVSDAVKELLDRGAFNINRGGYEEAYEISERVLETRELLCRMFDFDRVRNVIFTPSVTYSLNYLIKGYFKPGDHVICSSMEHNAVIRPLVQMEKQGAAFDAAQADERGQLDPERVEALIRPTSVEPRTTVFYVKPEYREAFPKLFREAFPEGFLLMTAEEFRASGILGPGEYHPKVADLTGDYVALSMSEACLEYQRREPSLVGMHAGMTAAEMRVPLIAARK